MARLTGLKTSLGMSRRLPGLSTLNKGVWLVLNGLLVNNQPLLVNNTAMKVTPNADA
tara:strand:- start:16707 stop:16877 length:171 start_codon:yes stop_codon:yes gene_type:complete